MNLHVAGQLKNSKFWLAAIAVGLTLIQLDLTSKLGGGVNRLSIATISLVAILYLLWKNRRILSLQSDILSSLCGLLLISIVLFKSSSLYWFESDFIRIYSLLSFLGLALLASGFKGLKQYVREFIIMFIFLCEGLLISLISLKIDFSTLAAKFSTFFLWYLGFEVSRQGFNVILPTGTIQIYSGCSGLDAIVSLLELSLLFILVFPLNTFHKILVPIMAVFLAFTINGFRLVLMALLVASYNHKAFEFWHGQPGAQIFSTVSILAFGFFCQFILHNQQALQNTLELKR